MRHGVTYPIFAAGDKKSWAWRTLAHLLLKSKGEKMMRPIYNIVT